MTRYYLIYGWDLAKRQIISPTIKEVSEGIWYVLPNVPGYKFVSCFCSKDKKEVEEWLNKTKEPFEKKNISYLSKTIKNMEKLCRLQEERIASASWKEVEWPEDDLPF